MSGTVALQRKLKRIRQSWKDGRPPRFHRRSALKVPGASKYSKCGPNGEMREHPTVLGMEWLTYFGEALRRHGAVWDWRVAATGWERDECVSLYLQRVVHREVSAKSVQVGPAGMRTAETLKVPMRGGMWEHWRVPVGLVNSHDVKALLRRVMAPKEADLVLASNATLQAMRGL